MSGLIFPFNTPALRVDQRLGVFYVVSLPAELLLLVTASDTIRAVKDGGNGYVLDGTQRALNDKRLSEIASYIERVDSAFPNSIILAANYNREVGFDQGELEDILSEENKNIGSSRFWTITEPKDGFYGLTIPTSDKLAAVIDGQHRLFSFARADIEAMNGTNLLCSVYIDLPKALQAQIFATINSTQKRVDRSLTYELFGYNISDEDERFWTPEKLAVFLTRKLGTDNGSPLRGRIIVAPKLDPALEELTAHANWRISTAVVVDGILRLFSSKPKRDADHMKKYRANLRSNLRGVQKDHSPLRDSFIEGNDLLIYRMVLNYLIASNDIFWSHANENSFIVRTVGVQAIFDILRKIAPQSLEEKNISVQYFLNRLDSARNIDFSEERFRNPSGSGRTIIRQEIEEAIGVTYG